MIKYLIWDFDGTLFNTYPSICNSIIKIFKKYNIPFDKTEIFEEIKKVDINVYTKNKSITNNFDFNKIFTEIKSEYYNNQSKYDLPFKGVKELCGYIKDHGKNFLITHRSYDSTLRLLKKNNMDHLFTKIINLDDGKFQKKPSPESFEYLIDNYNLNTSEIISIGDRELDIIPSNKTNIKSCYFNEVGKKLNNANYNISKIDELLSIIKKINDS